MQVLKDHIRNLIIENAVSDFYTYGFQKASLRKIVTDSGISNSNFYNYFNSKEDLFDVIVSPAYNKLLCFIKQDETEAEDLTVLLKKDLESIKSILKSEISGMDDKIVKALIILIEGSKGTKYENIKENLYNMLTQHILIHIKKTNITVSDYDFLLSQLLAKSFLTGILEILRNDCCFEEKERLLTDFLLVYTIGSSVFTSKKAYQ